MVQWSVVDLDEGGRGRAGTRLLAPGVALEPWVEYFWIQESEPSGANRNWRIVPDSSPHIIFASEISKASGEHRTRLVLAGPRAEFADIDMRRRRITIGARLRLGGLVQITGTTAAAFREQTFRLDEVLGPAARELAGRMSECEPEEAQSHLRRFLENRLATCEPDLSFERALQYARTVESLAQLMGCSLRTVHQRGVDRAGMSPMRLLRIVRLHRALRLASCRQARWVDVSYEAGFADQAHLIREFKALLGDTPDRWRGRRVADLFNTRRSTAC